MMKKIKLLLIINILSILSFNHISYSLGNSNYGGSLGRDERDWYRATITLDQSLDLNLEIKSGSGWDLDLYILSEMDVGSEEGGSDVPYVDDILASSHTEGSSNESLSYSASDTVYILVNCFSGPSDSECEYALTSSYTLEENPSGETIPSYPLLGILMITILGIFFGIIYLSKKGLTEQISKQKEY